MQRQECIAMILAGGQGSRLGTLTQKVAKPAVPFGARYRIIDFTLSNCRNSGIYKVGVLTQYQHLTLNNYIGTGSAWDLERKDGGVFILPPYMRNQSAQWYAGTADAVWQNTDFIDTHQPCYVIVLSGDHIYTMDYSKMLEYHKRHKAEATIGVIRVPWEETGRFGIMNVQQDGKIYEFQEKPEYPKSNLASMGIYIFNWEVLKHHLQQDACNPDSVHDFGKNIIPAMLAGGNRLMSYPFNGYWKDVGTVESFWEANMDLIGKNLKVNLYDKKWPIYTAVKNSPPHFIADSARIKDSLVNQGSIILGQVERSVIFSGVYIGEGAIVKDSVILPDVRIEALAEVNRAVIGSQAMVERSIKVGADSQEIVMVGEAQRIVRDYTGSGTEILSHRQVV
ncbi:Glucose-1-phosphate adenylyltransferase [Propionispora sp. 2/2-37]|uniref:glucose-1-phosphate adenylyltransferase n=1 Tax=Propionispora sp. 2/2-37 TaxID=1677858 RepID=UPI0006BB8F2B|nr:glucose-1-phosphate adenylyltransferase [Propionispora sp. 2/2-37]CUH95418.1 Glucose-1-phosphate adenylyltransferase [Propionispora sp. 2/2-37]